MVADSNDGLLRPARVLLVDDGVHLRQRLAFQLHCDGHDVMVLESARTLLQTLTNMRATVDLIIMDVRMPQRSGVAALSALRERGLTTPVLLLSASPDAATDERATDLGASLLAKPFAMTRLSSRVDELLRASRP